MSYYDFLKQLNPLTDLTGVIEPDMVIKGKWLDSVDSSAQSELDQMFPSTTDSSALADWMTFTDTTDQSSCLQVFSDFKNKTGWMNPNYFVGLCNRYGLDATVHEGVEDMFILAPSSHASLLPHALWDTPHRWTWILDTTGAVDSTTKSLLQTKIINGAPAWTHVGFTGSIA